MKKKNKQTRQKLIRWAKKSRQRGGFFPLLAPFMPAIISGLGSLATGAAGSLGAWGMSKAIKHMGGSRKVRRIRYRKRR
jgi:hypothetical protein